MAAIDELTAFIANARKALEGAKSLFHIGDYRGALSRAYYASFYAVSAVLLTDEQRYKKHSAVISAFNRSFIKTGRFVL
ncbi:MAG: HEPN domain-containing protein [Bacillota bacterium]